MVISPGVFLVFFNILIFWVVRGVKVQKMVQNVKKFCLYGTHLENDNIFSCFFHFFKSLIFRVVRGVKGQKMVQIDKKFCPLRSVFQELYII